MVPESTNGKTADKPVTNGDTNQIPREMMFAFQQLTQNIMMERSQLWNKIIDPRRNYEAECGYPEFTQLNPAIYRDKYDRFSIAARVVQLYPKECWQVQPKVYEDEDSENETEFEKAWDELGKQLRGNSFHKEEEGSCIWEYLLRADILSGIGHFGVLLLGIDDGLTLENPVEGMPKDGSDPYGATPYVGGDTTKPDDPSYEGSVEHDEAPPQDAVGTDAYYDDASSVYPLKMPKGEGKERKLLFLRAFDESLVQIVQYERDIRNPRFGQPIMYRITLNDPREQHSGVGLPVATVRVHWTRVIHIADNLNSSEIFGVPRMRPVFNNILDLIKLYGGSAEMYWRGAFFGISLETHPQLGGNVQIQQGQMQDMMEQWMNGLQRYLALQGMSAKTLAPQVVDPAAQIQVQIEAICIQLACPKRVFMGTERGELASNQDDASWNDRLRARQNNHITPRIIVPFVDRLIAMKILPEPEQFCVYWPDLDSNTDLQKAQIATTRTQALGAYVNQNIESLITPHNYLTKILGLDDEEATSILEETDAAIEQGEDGRYTSDPNDMQQQQFDLQADQQEHDQEIDHRMIDEGMNPRGGSPDDESDFGESNDESNPDNYKG